MGNSNSIVSEEDKKKKPHKTAIIIGVAVGVAILVLILINSYFLYVYLREPMVELTETPPPGGYVSPEKVQQYLREGKYLSPAEIYESGG